MYVLLIADIRESSLGEQDLIELRQSVSDKAEIIECLNAGAYLLNLKHGLDVLGHILYKANDKHVPLRALFFDEEPNWVRSTEISS